ncbi:hypothetical protein [Gymnodinialimonas sp.]
MLTELENERRVAEGALLIGDGIRHPFVAVGEYSPFWLFAACFFAAFLGSATPIWFSLGLLPLGVFATAWTANAMMLGAFEKRLAQAIAHFRQMSDLEDDEEDQ